MDNTHAITEMERALQSLREREKELRADIEALERSLSVMRGQQMTLLPGNLRASEKDVQRQTSEYARPMKLTPAILSIFDRSPGKKWTPMELRTELYRMKEQGTFITQSRDFFPALHGTLKELSSSERKVLVRDDRGGHISYRKAT